MYEAARVDDPIYHTSALAGALSSASPLSRLPPLPSLAAVFLPG